MGVKLTWCLCFVLVHLLSLHALLSPRPIITPPAAHRCLYLHAMVSRSGL